LIAEEKPGVAIPALIAVADTSLNEP